MYIFYIFKLKIRGDKVKKVFLLLLVLNIAFLTVGCFNNQNNDEEEVSITTQDVKLLADKIAPEESMDISIDVPEGYEVEWTAERGSFPNGNTGTEVVYKAPAEIGEDILYIKITTINNEDISINFNITVTNESETDRTINSQETFSLAFEENVSTGYKWFFTNSNSEVVAITDLGYNEDASCEDGVVGCSGSRTFLIEGLSNGESTLEFDLKRQEDEEPVESKVYTVTVQ